MTPVWTPPDAEVVSLKIVNQRVLLDLVAGLLAKRLPDEEPIHTLGIVWVIIMLGLALGAVAIGLYRGATRYFGLEDQDEPRRSGPRRPSPTVRRRRSHANRRGPASRSRR